MTAISAADRQATSLLDCGYTEVQEVNGFTVGDRVRHIGQKYPEAKTGTGTIERIFIRGRAHHEMDIEFIVHRDKPFFGPDDTHGFWANYHTVKATP